VKTKTEKTKINVPSAFRQWWEPWGIDKDTGASIGGHPDSYRIWARKDSGHYTHHHYGVNTESAWMTIRYRDEYCAWVEAGSPQREEDFVSVSAPLEKQLAFWRGLKPLIDRIAKPVEAIKHLPEEGFLDPLVEPKSKPEKSLKQIREIMAK
jgi:hypothetical protein